VKALGKAPQGYLLIKSLQVFGLVFGLGFSQIICCHLGNHNACSEIRQLPDFSTFFPMTIPAVLINKTFIYLKTADGGKLN